MHQIFNVKLRPFAVHIMLFFRNPNDDIIVQPGLLKVTANVVFGYAT